MAPLPLQLSSSSLGSTFHTPLSTSIAGSSALWWPCKVTPKVVLLFIPGNPGLSSYYIPYLSSIHHQLKGKVEIIAVSHRGHCSLPNNERAEIATSKGKGTSLQEQIQVKIGVIDKIRSIYPKSPNGRKGSNVKLLLVGHSVGAYIALQCLKERPNQIDSIQALFPTVSWISRTPNAKRLRLLLHPILPTIFLAIPIFLISFLPFFILIPLIRLLTFQSSIAARSTSDFITTKGAVRNSLRMAREEMKTIKGIQPDVKFEISKFNNSSSSLGDEEDERSLRFYWSKEEEDSWAPKWLRHQVEDELKLKKTLIPFNIMNPITNGNGLNGYDPKSIGKSFLAGSKFSPLTNRLKHQSKKSDSSFFPPISKIDYNSTSTSGTSSSIGILGDQSSNTIVQSPSPTKSPINLPLSNNVNIYAQGRSPSMNLGHKRKNSLVAATATRGLDGTIQIETEVDPFVSSEDDDDEDLILGGGALSKADEIGNGDGKGKGKEVKRRNKDRLTSTVCTIGMPHAFCLNHGEPMAKITSYWIKEDLL